MAKARAMAAGIMRDLRPMLSTLPASSSSTMSKPASQAMRRAALGVSHWPSRLAGCLFWSPACMCKMSWQRSELFSAVSVLVDAFVGVFADALWTVAR